MEHNDEAEEAFKSYSTIVHQELHQAVLELKRPALGLLSSGFLAGFGLGVTPLLVTVMMSFAPGTMSELMLEILRANLYTVGFILVIVGRTDLFTEYTTVALLPVLTGEAPVRHVCRLWGLIYVSNLLGGGLFGVLLVVLGPGLDVVRVEIFSELASRLVGHSWWILLASAGLAGWLMGFLSWLVTAARETISQIFIIWMVIGVIALGHLHHVISGAIEMIMAVLSSEQIGWRDVGYFLFWVTLGNILGSISFAFLIRFSALIGGSGQGKRAQ
jgi:formate-nitrite transporter family protein